MTTMMMMMHTYIHRIELQALRDTLHRNDAAQVEASAAARRHVQEIEAAAEAAHAKEIERLQKKAHAQKEALREARKMVKRVQAEVQRVHSQQAHLGAERWRGTAAAAQVPSPFSSVGDTTAKHHSFQWDDAAMDSGEEAMEEEEGERIDEEDESEGSDNGQQHVTEARAVQPEREGQFPTIPVPFGHQESLSPSPGPGLSAHQSYDLGAELGLDDSSTVVDASFYGSGISLGLHSGDEDVDGRDNNSPTWRRQHADAGELDESDQLLHRRRPTASAENRARMTEVSSLLNRVGGRVDPILFDAEPWVDGQV